MRRPLALLCAVSVIWMAVSAAGNRIEDSPPFQTREALLEALEGERDITVRGNVAMSDAISAGLRLSVDQLSIQKQDKSVLSISPEFKITFTTEENKILPGDAVTVQGEFDVHETAGNPGEFDAQEYYLSMDVIGTLWEARITEHEKGDFSVRRMLGYLRRMLADSYANILEEKSARTMAAISLGEKSLMEREWKTLYQEGGIAHIFAVSGLHVSLVGMSLFRLLRRLGVSYRLCSLLSGSVVFLYGLMTGFSISAMRAVVMFFLWSGAQICGRKNDVVTSTSLAAALLVLLDVRNAGQSAFWLSFGAVLCVSVAAPAAQQMCAVKSAFGKSLVSGTAVWLGTLPCVLYFFYQAVPWSILLNLAVIPLMAILMASGLIAAAVGLVSVPLGTFLAAPVYYLLEAFERLCRLQQELPHALWVAGRPTMLRIVLYYAVFAGMLFLGHRKNFVTRMSERLSAIQNALWNRTAAEGKASQMRFAADGELCEQGSFWRTAKCRLKTSEKGVENLHIWHFRLLWLAACFLCPAIIGVRLQRELQVTFFDVGQGDCALVRLPDGTDCLIDGGSTSQKKVWEYEISQSVKYYGVSTLDYVFLSHADVDHISGIQEFLASYECNVFGENVHGITMKHLVLPPTSDPEDFAELQTLAKEKGIEVLTMDAGDAIGSQNTLSGEGGQANRGWQFACLAPYAEQLSGESNEDSMVLKLSYGDFRALFTGDLEKGAERALVASGVDLSCDVLKVGHHGSAGASSDAFLAAAKPALGVISCGENNRYGHPAKETVERLTDAGCRIFRTDECGAVTVRSNGAQFLAVAFFDFL